MNQNRTIRLTQRPDDADEQEDRQQVDEAAPVRDDDPVEEREHAGPRCLDLVDHGRILAVRPDFERRIRRPCAGAACGGRPSSAGRSWSSRRGRASRSSGAPRRRRRGVLGRRARRRSTAGACCPPTGDAWTGRSIRPSSHWSGTVRAPFAWSRSRSSRSLVTASTGPLRRAGLHRRLGGQVEDHLVGRPASRVADRHPLRDPAEHAVPDPVEHEVDRHRARDRRPQPADDRRRRRGAAGSALPDPVQQVRAVDQQPRRALERGAAGSGAVRGGGHGQTVASGRAAPRRSRWRRLPRLRGRPRRRRRAGRPGGAGRRRRLRDQQRDALPRRLPAAARGPRGAGRAGPGRHVRARERPVRARRDARRSGACWRWGRAASSASCARRASTS